jgi:hypothetical protein
MIHWRARNGSLAYSTTGVLSGRPRRARTSARNHRSPQAILDEIAGLAAENVEVLRSVRGIP